MTPAHEGGHGYPRPLLQREAWTSLNGPWEFALDRDGVWTLSWGALARRAATLTRLDPALVEECEPAVLGHVAPRPAYSALGSERGELLPTLDEALDRYLAERRSA